MKIPLRLLSLLTFLCCFFVGAAISSRLEKYLSAPVDVADVTMPIATARLEPWEGTYRVAWRERNESGEHGEESALTIRREGGRLVGYYTTTNYFPRNPPHTSWTSILDVVQPDGDTAVFIWREFAEGRRLGGMPGAPRPGVEWFRLTRAGGQIKTVWGRVYAPDGVNFKRAQ